ncbi:MAG: hypothetical protein JWR24_4475 [Actinoallomurus sp.]|nr:hypothetical protein [Actinoallomurus sp.]
MRAFKDQAPTMTGGARLVDRIRDLQAAAATADTPHADGTGQVVTAQPGSVPVLTTAGRCGTDARRWSVVVETR